MLVSNQLLQDSLGRCQVLTGLAKRRRTCYPGGVGNLGKMGSSEVQQTIELVLSKKGITNEEV